MGIANRAATYHAHLCECEKHGYSWGERYGDGSRGVCYVECEGQVAGFNYGDFDCSSSVIDAYKEALMGTPYEGALDAATYTGNMRSVFVGSGLFEWHGMDFIAQRGDIYLNESSHTAMCQSPSPDILSEFSINEHGEVYGGQWGDQTGWESIVRGYYDFPWDGILHFIGDDDVYIPSTPSEEVSDIELPEYELYTREHGWLGKMRGLSEVNGGPDNFAGIEGCWAYDFRCSGLGQNGWYEIERADGSVSRNSSGNTDSPITGICVYYDTDTSKTGGVYYKAKYKAHWQGSNPDWGDWEYDDEDPRGLGRGAGKDSESPIDMFMLTLERE